MSPQRKVLITGASSFIGCHLAHYFHASGRYAVVATGSQPLAAYRDVYRERLEDLASAGVVFRQLNLVRPREIKTVVREVHPDYCIHHAGHARAYGSLDYDLQKGQAVNVAPLGGLYGSLAACGCKGVVITGSSAEYTDSDDACREDACCLPTMPYGLSKLAETIFARQMARLHQLPTRVARVFIPYGPRDAAAKLISSVVTALEQGQAVELSACLQKRDFIHVEDLVSGYDALLDDTAAGPVFDIYNVCSGVALPLKELLLQLAGQMGADPGLLQFGQLPMRAGEPPVSYGSTTKIKRRLNWLPAELESGLRRFLASMQAGGAS